MHQHQVALVPQHGVDGALSGCFAGRQRCRGFARDLLLARRAQLAPLRPAETEHLVQHAQPFKGERHCRQFSGHGLYSGIVKPLRNPTQIDVGAPLIVICRTGESAMPRGITPRQPSRSGRHDKVCGHSAAGERPDGQKGFACPEESRPRSRRRSSARSWPRRKPLPASLRAKLLRATTRLRHARVSEILKRLDERYPAATCALHHKSAWELLVATILSAQCTDVRVNMVTPVLFEKYPTPEAFAALKPEELEADIRSTGFFRNKSKSLVGAARKLISDFGGEVPRTMDELLQLPGVARKTANVVLGTWFKIADGVVVDTHVTAHLAPSGADEERRPAEDRAGPDEGRSRATSGSSSRTRSSCTGAQSASPAVPSAPTVRWRTSATPPTRRGARWRFTSRQSREAVAGSR